MPRGVYDRSKRKKSGNTTAVQAFSPPEAPKQKRAYTKRNAMASVSSGARTSSPTADSSSFITLTNYLQQVSQARHNLSSSPELDQEIKATVKSLASIREQLFSGGSEQSAPIQQSHSSASGSSQSNEKTSSPAASGTAPVPFNPPTFNPAQAPQ